jgi:predicted phosphoadenosine phosphosulfate sulfurtransferase
VNQYISEWKGKGYADGIPDEVPDALMRLNLAPSWKAIAIAILKNDLQFLSLGYPPKKSEWYSALKREEIEHRDEGRGHTLSLFRNTD